MKASALQRRLHGLELAYLRELAADLLAERDALEARCNDLERALSWSDNRADMFQDALNDMAERTDSHIGLTVAGALMLAPEPHPMGWTGVPS